MQKIKAVKHTAKTALKNKWPSAICVFAVAVAAFSARMLLATLLSMIFANQLSSPIASFVSLGVNAFLQVIDLFAVAPLYLGVLRWFWRLTAGAEESVYTLFYYYNSSAEYKKAIGVAFGFIWRYTLYSIICFLPMSAAIALQGLTAYAPMQFSVVLTVLLLYAVVFTAILGVILLILLLSKIFPVAGVLFSDETLSARECFRIAKMISKGRRGGFMYLLLTFFGYMAMCVIAIPILWVAPYMLASFSVFTRYSITDFNLEYSSGPEEGILAK